MKSVPVHLLKPGVVFSSPVYINENDILVPANVPIQQKDIDDLAEKGIASVLTDGVPGFSSNNSEKAAQDETAFRPSLIRTPSPFSLSEIRENKGAYRIYIQLIERLHSIFYRISSSQDRTLDNRPVNEISASLLQVVRNQRDRFVGFILGSDVKGFDLAKSSVNTAILSSIVAQAQEKKYPHYKILHIIIGSLLHDVGMLRLPKEILNKQGKLSAAENKQMQSHPLIAYQITVKELSYPDEVGRIVLQHHERWDGAGYPNRLTGPAISDSAQIVSIADAFEAMVSRKPYRDPILGNQAMKNLLADNSRRFNPDILKSFTLTMGLYPLGSIVRLNNGLIGRISEVRAAAPMRPKIHVLIDQNKKTALTDEKVFVDLLIEKDLFITKTMDMRELSEDDA